MTDVSNAVVWMVSSHLLISKSSSPCIKTLVTVPNEPMTIGITVIFMFHSFSVLKVLISLFAFLQFYLEVSRNGKVHPSTLFFLLTIIRTGRLAHIRWSICISKSHRFCVSHFPWQILVCAYTIYFYGQILSSWTIPSGSPCPPSRV